MFEILVCGGFCAFHPGSWTSEGETSFYKKIVKSVPQFMMFDYMNIWLYMTCLLELCVCRSTSIDHRPTGTQGDQVTFSVT